MARKRIPSKKTAPADNYMFLTLEVEQLVRDISENLGVTHQDAFLLLYGAGRQIAKREMESQT